MAFTAYASPGLALAFLGIFFCVLLHEFGHCLMAKFLDVQVKNIHLFPIGGVAQVEMKWDEPKKELPITIAGPAVNVILAPICYILAGLFPPDTYGWAYFTLLTLINIVMVVFNLIPMFPMDGGRIFRSTWALLGGNQMTATYIAVRLGQVLSVAFALIGCYIGAVLWPFIAMLLIAASEAELSVTRRMSFLKSFKELNEMMDKHEAQGYTKEQFMEKVGKPKDPHLEAIYQWRLEKAGFTAE